MAAALSWPFLGVTMVSMKKGCDDRYGDLDWLIAIVANWKNESS